MALQGGFLLLATIPAHRGLLRRPTPVPWIPTVEIRSWQLHLLPIAMILSNEFARKHLVIHVLNDYTSFPGASDSPFKTPSSVFTTAIPLLL